MTPPGHFGDPATAHPALRRFLAMPAGEERLLIVRAPSGTGAHWLAAGWVAEGDPGPDSPVPALRVSGPVGLDVPLGLEAPDGPDTSAGVNARGGLDVPAGPQAPVSVDAPVDLYGPSVRARVLSWDQAGGQMEAFIDRLGTLLNDPGGGRVAVVGGHDVPVGPLMAAFSARLAGPADVLLTVDEIQSYSTLERIRRPRPVGAHGSGSGGRLTVNDRAAALRAAPGVNGRGPVPLTPLGLHVKTGGWLRALRILLDDPFATHAAKLAITPSLTHWLGTRDGDGEIAATAFLPEITEEILAAFHALRPHTGSGPSMQRLQDLGVLVRCADGRWRMPALLREVLKDAVVEADPQRAHELGEAAMDAVTTNVGVEAAMESAVVSRAWHRLSRLVTDHWVDLYIQNAPALARVLALLPRHVLGGAAIAALVSRLVAVTGENAMDYILPSSPPDYARDEVAQALRARTARMHHEPGHRSITFGIAEVGHLRLAGHYTEAGQAAERLRTAVDAAMDVQRVRPGVAGFTELQAGIALHLADRLPEAKAAYEAAYFWARTGGVDFIKADAAGKLALLSAHAGSLCQARHWIAQVEEPLSSVRWGRPMVARAASLARIHVAVAEMDLPTVRRLLAGLPIEPDTDEFWSAHAQLIAQALSLEGNSEEGANRIMDWRKDRPHAARSPLADRLFTETYHLCALASGRIRSVPGWDRNPMLANLEAVRCLRQEDVDGALRALRLPERTNTRHRAVAAMVGVIARAQCTPDTADESVQRQLASIHRQGAELADLAYFHPFGWTPVFLRLGLMDEAAMARVAELTNPAGPAEDRPSLTRREEEVLRMLREGLTRRQMATSTYRSENTIKGQLRSLYAKLGAATAKQALEVARRLDL